MTCPECGSENRDSAERCDACGQALALAVGTVLADRYEIKSLLGVGGLGRVYRAHDRLLDEVVAVKVLHPEAARSPEMSRRFRSEIKLARKVRHRNVCAIHEYGEHQAYRFVAMELVDGVDLHRVLRERGPLPPREAFDILLQVTKGLAAIHGAGVIHRDLKTPNIMRDAKGDVRLLDFGIAKLRTPTGTLAVTAVQKVVGTPEYMSPEQIRGDDLDERSDIYGLGVVIYELVTGTVPFQGKSPLDTLVKHMNTPPPLYGEATKQLPPSLVPILRRCLAKRAEERYSSARELLEALRVARNSAFPESAVTPEGMSALEHETGEPVLKTSVLPRASRAPKPEAPPIADPATPRPTAPPATPGHSTAPARPASTATPPAVAPPVAPPTPPRTPDAPHPFPPVHSAAPAGTAPPLARSAGAAPSTPPSGPPKHPLAGAPPLPAPSSRESAAEAALLHSDTYLELPQQPSGTSPPLPPRAPRAWNPSFLGAGLAFLGLLALGGAWLMQARQPGEGRPTATPLTTTTTLPLEAAATPHPETNGPSMAAVGTESPVAPPSPSPEPVAARAELPPPAADPAATLPEAKPVPEPTPRPRRRPSPSPTPTPTPTPAPTPTPEPVTTGTLDLETQPAADIEIDDAPAVTSPLRGVELKAGTRIVKLSHPDFWPITRRLSVEAGRALRLDVDLSWEALPRARSREAPFATALSGSPEDPYFERGLRQLASGDFSEALLHLEPVARRLQQAGKEKELARCEFYLGVALLELGRQGSAKERFERALENDRSLRLPPASFSAKVTTFFALVREAASKKP